MNPFSVHTYFLGLMYECYSNAPMVWVATCNYELGSGAYFINLLWNYFQTNSIFARER